MTEPVERTGFLGWVARALAGRVITGVVLLGTVGAGYWFWKHPEHLALLWKTAKYALAWVAFVAALPWATFFLTSLALNRGSNRASAALLIAYTAADAAVAIWLAGGVQSHNTLTWVVLCFGILVSAIYNYASCEFIARRMEDV